LVKQAKNLAEQGLYGRFPAGAQRRRLPMAWQVSQDHVAVLDQHAEHGIPRLSPVPEAVEKHKGLPAPDSFEGQPHLDLPPECRPTTYAPPGQPLWLDSYPRNEFESHPSQEPRR
jgi:hypothetical protein